MTDPDSMSSTISARIEMKLGDLANVRLLEERGAELGRLRRMRDRYIANAQADVVLQTDEFWRLGMLQEIGAAELNERELPRLCHGIVNCGLQDLRHREISAASI